MKKTIIYAVVIFLILAASFYWFQIRVVIARKDCADKITKISSNGSGANAQDYAMALKICMYQHGLKK